MKQPRQYGPFSTEAMSVLIRDLRKRLAAAEHSAELSEQRTDDMVHAVRKVIHTNACSDECGWFAFWQGDTSEEVNARFEDRVTSYPTEADAVEAWLLHVRERDLTATRTIENLRFEVKLLKEWLAKSDREAEAEIAVLRAKEREGYR